MTASSSEVVDNEGQEDPKVSEPAQAPQWQQPAAPKPKGHTGRNIVIGAVILVVLAAIGSQAGQKPTPAAGNGGSGGGGGTGGGAPAGPVTLLTLSGNGIKNSQTFTTTGPWTIAYSYDCSSFGSQGNFAITVADSSGGLKGVPVNELGAKGSSSTQDYDTGDLHLEMNSECAWTVKATQP